jgi:hypothetical protein
MSARLALIIGNSLFRDETLTKLKKPDADVGALADLLLDPEVGGFDDAKLLVNMSSTAVRRAISEFFTGKRRDDMLLLYFSGHGILDDQGRLFLAVKDTDRKLLNATAIPTTFVADEMNNSRSKRQVLVLDCCHSGAFSRDAKGVSGARVGTAVLFEGTGYGRVVLTASDATQYAWEGDQIIGEAENSLFTHFMVRGMQSGDADLNGDGRITVDELYDYVYDEVIKRTSLQTPGKWSYKEQGEIIIAQNPLHQIATEEAVTTTSPDIKISFNRPQLTVEPGEKEKISAILHNDGGAGEKVQVSIEGIPAAWVSPPTVTTSLMPGERKEVIFTVYPPRVPQSLAGEYEIILKASGQDTKTDYASTNVKLTVLPFSMFSSELIPRKIMSGASSAVGVENLGNVDDTFQVTLKDDAGELDLKPVQAQLHVPVSTKGSLEFYAKPINQDLFGRKRNIPFTATIRPSGGEAQIVNGELVSKSSIPIWLVPVIVLLCITTISAGIIISQLSNGRDVGVVQVKPPTSQISSHVTSPAESDVITSAVPKPKPITTTAVPKPKPITTTAVPEPIQKTLLAVNCILSDVWSSNSVSASGQNCLDFSKWGINAISDGLNMDYYNNGGEVNVGMYTNLNLGDTVEFDISINQLDTPAEDILANISLGVVPNSPLSLESGRYAIYQKESPKTGYPVFIKHQERGGYDAYIQKDDEYIRYPLGTINHLQFEWTDSGVSIYIDGYKISAPDPVGSGNQAFWIGIRVPSNGAIQAKVSNFEIHQ